MRDFVLEEKPRFVLFLGTFLVLLRLVQPVPGGRPGALPVFFHLRPPNDGSMNSEPSAGSSPAHQADGDIVGTVVGRRGLPRGPQFSSLVFLAAENVERGCWAQGRQQAAVWSRFAWRMCGVPLMGLVLLRAGAGEGGRYGTPDQLLQKLGRGSPAAVSAWPRWNTIALENTAESGGSMARLGCPKSRPQGPTSLFLNFKDLWDTCRNRVAVHPRADVVPG